MINKKDQSDPIDNLEYEKVLEEEIINSYESKFLQDTEPDKKKTKFYKLKKTPKNKKISTIIPTFIRLIFYPFFFLLVPSMYGTRIFNNHFLNEFNGFKIFLLAFSPQTPPFDEIFYIWPSCY